MATNFFENQDRARKKTGLLVFFFAAAVVAILATVYALAVFVVGFQGQDPSTGAMRWNLDWWSPELLSQVVLFTLLIVGGGSLYKIAQLRGGGSAVAEGLGGRLLHANAVDPTERKLLNVVEEMAIASGTATPPVYLLAVGFGLMVIGFLGTFFGNLIKASVSRQREFFADASAVQFTRNPDGIAGALKKIAGLGAGSRIEHPNAPEASHMFFGRALPSLFSTHPPLEERIRRLDPSFDQQLAPPAQEPAAAGAVSGFAAGSLGAAVDQIGAATPAHVDRAAQLIARSPTARPSWCVRPRIRSAARCRRCWRASRSSRRGPVLANQTPGGSVGRAATNAQPAGAEALRGRSA